MHIKTQLNISKISYLSCQSFAQKLWLFLDCLQKVFRLFSLAFRAFYISIAAYHLYSIKKKNPFITVLLDFTVCLKRCLNPIPLFSQYNSTLNAFLDSVHISPPTLSSSLRSIANAPYFHTAFLKTFPWLSVFILDCCSFCFIGCSFGPFYLVLLSNFSHIYICLFYLPNYNAHSL